MNEKQNFRDKYRRLKFFPCAVELIENSKKDPESIENPDRKSEIFHRFFGKTPKDELFCVQIKEDKRTENKYLISIFPFKEN